MDSPYKSGWWTPERESLSERRRRESSSLARYVRRMRELAATAERFDPQEVYERDAGMRSLREVRRPRPHLARCHVSSLDHVIPASRER